MAKPLALGVMTVFHGGPAASMQTVRELGVPTVQVLYPQDTDSEDGIAQVKQAAQENGIEITTVFAWFEGESYADIAEVRATVGLIPEKDRESRIERVLTIAKYAKKLGVRRVAAHIGFVPEDETNPLYAGIVVAVQRICDALAKDDQVFALETGQETAATLRRLIDDVARPNLCVNFDPANMILYGNDQPIPATEKLAPFIDGVHCKDGCWPTEEGKLGEEKPLGQGDVDIEAWIRKLIEIGYTGPLTIEREISGDQQKKDILAAVALLEGIVEKSS